jgi:excinuclease ABC subunit C
MVARIARIEAVVCDSEHEAAWLERNLLEQSMPAWNRTPGGQEVSTYLRLDAGQRTPRLEAVHSVTSSGAHFGPYLGGDKVRTAVAAFHRAFPLAYTGNGLSGSEREMAGQRGVGPADRDRLAGTITAVLQRDPTAMALIREALQACRDRAALAQAYELAARIQAEIEAVAWVTSVQRVTRTDGPDADAAGWSDGVLVRFQVRAGRLRRWAQRACGQASARRYLAETPAAWADFAGRNAELAARLIRSHR